MELYKSGKYIICQPLGGINDMLCQIGHCIEYAEKFNRTLIIDAITSDLNDHFSNYFQLANPTEFIHIRLEDAQVHVIQHDPTFNIDIALRYEASDLKTHPLDMYVDSVDKFVLHRAYGGGLQSLYALKYFTLLPHIADKIKNTKNSLGEYHAVLIRNTDYQTDYQQALTEIRSLSINNPLYLFTDDYTVQNYAKTLGFSKLIVNENLYKSDDTYLPIMHVCRVSPKVPAIEINVQVLSDLFLSALADHIYPTYIVGYLGDRRFANGSMQSGFIRLSIALNQDKVLLNSILSIT